MNELYWISVLGKLNTAFWVGVGVCLAILLVANVHYVHELQQLLRLGGYTELANNVKL